MNLTLARQIVRYFARNGGDSSMYPDAQIDLAVAGICDDFIDHTNCTLLLSTAAAVANSGVIDISGITDSSGQSTFRPQRLRSAYMDGVRDALRQVTWEQIWRDQLDQESCDQPNEIAFSDYTTCQIYPVPTADATLYLRWNEPITNWTPGTESGTDAIIFNLPDDWMRRILMWGAPALLQGDEPEHKYTTVAWQRYVDFRESMRGQGNLGAMVSSRARAF